LIKTDYSFSLDDSQTLEVKQISGDSYKIVDFINDLPKVTENQFFERFNSDLDESSKLEYIFQYFKDRFMPYNMYANGYSRNDRFLAFQKWQCRVTEITKESFSAIVTNLTDEHKEDEVVEFSLADVSDSDKELLNIGAIFYWSIGYLIKIGGTKIKSQIIKFKRLPKWSQEEIDQAYEEAGKLRRELGIE